MTRGLIVVLLSACACGRTDVRPGFDTDGEATLAVQPGRLVFPPTPLGTTSSLFIELMNPGAIVGVDMVATPPFRAPPIATIPGEGRALALVEFAPTQVGLATGTLSVSSKRNEELAIALEGEGTSRCVAGCNDGNACTVDLCADPEGCFHEPVICPPVSSACEVSECHAAFGCRTFAMPDGTPCGTSACGGTNICRAGQCAESGGPTRLVGHWTFDEPEGTTIFDSSGLGHHGVLVAGARVPSLRNRGISHSDGSLLVDVAEHPDFAFAGSFTVQVWMETPDRLPMGQEVIVFRGDLREGLDPLVFSLQSHGAKFLVESPFDGLVVDPRTPIPTSTPVQLTGVFDAEALEARLYLDCVLADAMCSTFASAIGELNANLEPGVGLGGHARRGGTLYPFRGVLDEVLLYEGAMTEAEVAASCAP